MSQNTKPITVIWALLLLGFGRWTFKECVLLINKNEITKKLKMGFMVPRFCRDKKRWTSHRVFSSLQIVWLINKALSCTISIVVVWIKSWSSSWWRSNWRQQVDEIYLFSTIKQRHVNVLWLMWSDSFFSVFFFSLNLSYSFKSSKKGLV